MRTKNKKTTNNLSERVMTSEKLEEIYHKINFGEPLKRHESIWFKNISGVRKNGIQWGWTQEELEEYTRCKLDVHYFAENYCKIKREDGSVGKIQLRPYQKDILDLFANNRYSILCASRQSGKCLNINTLIRIKNNDIEETITIGDLFKRYFAIEDIEHNIIWNGDLIDKLYKTLSIIDEDIYVLALDKWVKIEELNITKKINTYTLYTKSGRKLTGAGQHMIMTDKGWNCIENLKENDIILSGIELDYIDYIVDNNKLEVLFDLTTESGDYLSAGNIIDKFDLSTIKNSNISSIRHDFTFCKSRIKSFLNKNIFSKIISMKPFHNIINKIKIAGSRIINNFKSACNISISSGPTSISIRNNFCIISYCQKMFNKFRQSTSNIGIISTISNKFRNIIFSFNKFRYRIIKRSTSNNIIKFIKKSIIIFTSSMSLKMIHIKKIFCNSIINLFNYTLSCINFISITFKNITKQIFNYILFIIPIIFPYMNKSYILFKTFFSFIKMIIISFINITMPVQPITFYSNIIFRYINIQFQRIYNFSSILYNFCINYIFYIINYFYFKIRNMWWSAISTYNLFTSYSISHYTCIKNKFLKAFITFNNISIISNTFKNTYIKIFNIINISLFKNIFKIIFSFFSFIKMCFSVFFNKCINYFFLYFRTLCRCFYTIIDHICFFNFYMFTFLTRFFTVCLNRFSINIITHLNLFITIITSACNYLSTFIWQIFNINHNFVFNIAYIPFTSVISNSSSNNKNFNFIRNYHNLYIKENTKSFNDLDNFKNSSLVSHNTISASIFILHYLTFNQDKGICIAANKAKTTQEILDKIKNIYKQLPFFLKVGLVNWGAKTLSFENGCRIMTEARSKEPSIGFTIDLLYLDEFAHIPANYIEPYYKSVVPTVSSIQNSKIIITSTPNGFNLFHKIWEGANLPKGHPNKNPYKALKVLWYEVTDSKNRRYREDAWLQYNKQYMDKNKITEDKLLKALKDIGANLYVQKQADEDTGEIVEFMAVEKKPGLTIDDLRNLNILNHKAIDLLNISSWSEREIKLIGGKENFDQEYNLHFLAGSKRVLEPETLELISKTKLDFVWKYNSILEKRFGEGGYDFIRWHPELYDSIDFKNDFIFASVDLAEGLGQDYTVFNIFKLFVKEKDELELKGVKQIQDAFQLKQIGILHTNRISVDIDAPEYFYTLFFEVFNPIKTKIALEYNTFGSTLVASLQNVYNSKNKFGKYIFIKYKHRIDDEKKHIGIKLNSENKKIYVKNYVIKLHNNSVIIYEMNTANEINNFVKHETNAGNYVYRAEIGHDDIVMSLVHACTIPDERCFIDACKMFYNNMDSITRNLIKKLLGYKDTNNNVKSAASILTGAKKEAYGGKYNKSFESREGGRYSKYLGYE